MEYSILETFQLYTQSH